MEKNFDTENKERYGTESLLTAKMIAVMEEHLHIDKEVVETGRVHISKKVLQEDYQADIPVFREEVVVERKPVNHYVDNAPGIRIDGDVTIIPVVKEVIIKRLLLVEELHISKKITENTVPVHEVLRKEEVYVTRTDNPPIGESNNI